MAGPDPELRQIAAAIAVKCIGQTPARFGGVGLALKHDVRHSQLGVATYRRRHLRHSADQWVVEEARFLRLEIWKPDADQRGDPERRRITSDRLARSPHFRERSGDRL